MTATLEVVDAPPYCTVQDLGRRGLRAAGVPAGGAMDPWTVRAANRLLGNPEDAAVLEWADGGGTLRVLADTHLVLAGAHVAATLGERPVAGRRVFRAPAGSTLRIGQFFAQRFLYIAVRGGIDVPPILGSRSTYLPAQLGGVEGRRLRRGDRLVAGTTDAPPPVVGRFLPPEPDAGTSAIRVLAGPQRDLVGDAAWTALLETEWRVSRMSDRTGYRLDGPAVRLPATLGTLPSEPGCPGTVQLPALGYPIVLLADAPTVGGYPKPAVVCTADLSRLAQCRPGDPVRFATIHLDGATALLRAREAWVAGVRG
jgi:antagonist of KipI